jgi:cellulose synthase/poly-beta-1,6-N-acetylglucosamine synthase-like glycosyltransferase
MKPVFDISVVIPCYNSGSWIFSCLESIAAQDLPASEVILVDDGSTDGSIDLVQAKFPETRILQQRNGGAAVARNAGIEAARGDWVAFIDADDWWLPGKLRAQVELLTKRPEAQMCFTAWEVWHCDSPAPDDQWLDALENQQRQVAGAHPSSGWIYPELLVGCCVWTSAVMARTSLLRKLGGFDINLKIGEDYDLWLRASRVTPIVRVTRPLALYRQHPNSLTRQPTTINHEALVVERAIGRWGYEAPDGRSADVGAVKRALARTWQNYGAAHLEAGHIGLALKGALKSVRMDWQLVNGWKLIAKALCHSLRLGAPRRVPQQPRKKQAPQPGQR